MNGLAGGIVEALSGLFAVASIVVSLIVLLNVRGAATSITSLNERLGATALGALFRGQQSMGLTRLLAIGLLLVGLQPVFRLSAPGAAIGSAAPTDFLLVLFVWVYIVYAVLVRVRSGFRGMVPPVTFLFTMALVTVYVGDAVALTSLRA